MQLDDDLFGGATTPVVSQPAPQSVPAAAVPALGVGVTAAGSGAAAASPVQASPVQAYPVKRLTSPSWQGWVITGLVCLVLVMVGMEFRRSLPDDTPGPKVDSLHALIVYESDPKLSKTTPEQSLALRSVKVREWLDANAKEKTGAPTWRMLDQDADTKLDAPIWGELLSQPRASEPWLIMRGGRRSISEPLADGGPEAVLKQLEKGK